MMSNNFNRETKKLIKVTKKENKTSRILLLQPVCFVFDNELYLSVKKIHKKFSVVKIFFFLIVQLIGQLPSLCKHHCGCKVSAATFNSARRSRCINIRGSASRQLVDGLAHNRSANALKRGQIRPSNVWWSVCSDHSAASAPKNCGRYFGSKWLKPFL